MFHIYRVEMVTSNQSADSYDNYFSSRELAEEWIKKMRKYTEKDFDYYGPTEFAIFEIKVKETL